MIYFGSNSLVNYATDYIVTGTCMILTILGSIGFIVINDLIDNYKNKKKNKLSYRKTWTMLSVHTKLVLTMIVFMITIGTLGFLLFEYKNPNTLANYNIFDKIFISLFHGISARTTGMAAVDLSKLTNSGKFFTIILMFIGGAPGSTAGGLKVTTLGILLITMLSSSSGNKNVSAYKREIDIETIKQAITILLSALIISSLICMTLAVLNPQIAFIDILFETISALATCGYSLGITASLTTISKVLLIFTMYIGRVSTITITMALAGKRFKQNSTIQYPKARVSL